MADFYIRQNSFAEVEPKGLLQWCEAIANQVSEENIYRNREGRVTLRFEHQQKSYFMKIHRGSGWGESIKNWLQLR